MTRKENLYAEYIDKLNKYNEISGENRLPMRITQMKSSEIEDEIERWDRAYLYKDKEIKIGLYWKKHSAEEYELKAKMESLRMDFEVLQNITKDKLSEMFEEYEVKRVNLSKYRSEVVFKLANIQWGEIEFGYENETWGTGGEGFKTNVGTTGPFDVLPTEQESRAKFYIAIGKLLSDTERMTLMRDTLRDANEKIKAISKEYDKCEEELNNPKF